MEFFAGSSPWKRPTRTEHNLFVIIYSRRFLSAHTALRETKILILNTRKKIEYNTAKS